MFAVIDVNGANRIAIQIPLEGSEKSLPALAAMLETNAVFIYKGYNEARIVKPEMQILLGETVSYDFGESELVVASSENAHVLGESFVLATPEVFLSNEKLIESKDKEIRRLEAECHLAHAKADECEAKVKELQALIQEHNLRHNSFTQEAA
jgi:hypothetical protein